VDGTDARMWIRLSQARPAAEQPVRIPSSRLTAGGISASEVAELEVGHPVSTVVAGGGEGGQSTTGCGRPRPEHARGGIGECCARIDLPVAAGVTGRLAGARPRQAVPGRVVSPVAVLERGALVGSRLVTGSCRNRLMLWCWWLATRPGSRPYPRRDMRVV